MTVRLSVCVITLNEADRLGQCLASVSGLADEIVVVDSGSTDGTRAVAERCGARWFERVPFPGWEAQKQWAMEQARGDWILSLDADEWLMGDSVHRIRSVLQEIELLGTVGSKAESEEAPMMEGIAGFRLTRRTLFLGRWLKGGNSAREPKLRLVRQGKGRWTGGDPHERLEVDGPVRGLGATIGHEPRRSLGEHVRAIDLYTSLQAPRLAGKRRIRLLFGIAVEPLLVMAKELILLGGVIDGARGVIHASLTSFDFFLRHAKAWEIRSAASARERRSKGTGDGDGPRLAGGNSSALS